MKTNNTKKCENQIEVKVIIISVIALVASVITGISALNATVSTMEVGATQELQV